MALIDWIDGPNRDIYLTSDSFLSNLHPMDIYREMRELRRTDEELRKFHLFLEAKGHEPKGSGTYTEMYVVQLEGTRFIPYDTSHVLTVVGTVITDDGQSGVSCFDRSPLSPVTIVDINYVPPQVEVIEVGTSGLTDQESDALLQNTADLSTMASSVSGIEGDIGLIQTDIASLQGSVANIEGDISVIKVDISDIKNDIISIETDIGNIQIDIANISVDMAFMKAIESGEWIISNNQMIFYDVSSVEIARFNLYNKIGTPTEDSVYRRTPV